LGYQRFADTEVTVVKPERAYWNCRCKASLDAIELHQRTLGIAPEVLNAVDMNINYFCRVQAIAESTP
jgi:hypothetical protein